MKIVLLYKTENGNDWASYAYGPFINYSVASQWYDANKPKLQAHTEFDIIDYMQIIS